MPHAPSRLRTALALSQATLVATLIARASAGELAGPIPVSTAPDFDTRTDCAYSGTQDEYLIVYDDDQGSPGGPHRIMAGRFDALLSPLDAGRSDGGLTSAVAISNPARSDAVAPKVAWLGPTTDAFLVAWLNQTTPSALEIDGAIVAATRTASAPVVTPLPAPIAVLRPGDTGFLNYSVGGRNDDVGWIVVYDVLRGSHGDVRAVEIGPLGSVGTPYDIAVSPTVTAWHSSVSRQAEGWSSWTAAWAQQDPGGGSHIEKATIYSGGGGVYPKTPITPSAGTSLDGPVVAVDGGGTVYVAMTASYATAANHDVYVVADSYGSLTSAHVPGFGSSDDALPAIAENGWSLYAAGGGILVAWSRARSPAATAAGDADVDYVRFDSSLYVLEGPVTVAAGGFTRPAAVGHTFPPPGLNDGMYLVACESVVSPAQRNPQAFVAGDMPPGPRLFEGSSSGAAIVSGSAAVGGRDFGVVSPTSAPVPPLVVFVENPGGFPLTVNAPVLSRGSTGDFAIGGPAFPVTLRTQESVTFTVTFAPQSTGVKRATVSVASSVAFGAEPAFTFDVTGQSRESTFRSAVAPLVAIPSGGGASVVGGQPRGTLVASTITASVPGNVLDVQVTGLVIDHPYASELVIFLRGPNGATVPLSLNHGGAWGGSNYTDTTFTDGAARSISTGTPPFTGAFRPESPLAAFRGIPAAGDWTLLVGDTSAGGYGGTLRAWSLAIEMPIGPAIILREIPSGLAIANGAAAYGGRAFGGLVAGAGGAAQSFDVANVGTQDLHLAVPSLVGSGDFSTTLSGTTLPPGGHATFDVRFDPSSLGVEAAALSLGHDGTNETSPFSFALEGVGSNLAGVRASRGTPQSFPGWQSVMTVPLAVPGTGTILAVAVTLDITYPQMGDFALTLIHPDGTRVPLTDTSLTGANMRGTRFDDVAPTSITAAAAPFTGSFAPISPLAALAGKPMAGSWVLEARTAWGFSSSGSVDSFTLDIAPALAPVVELREGSAQGPVIPNGAPAAGARNFGPALLAAATRPVTLFLRNAGTSPLHLGSPTVGGATPGDFSLPAALPVTLAPGASTTFTATFAPAALGARSASLAFTHDGTLAGTSPFVVSFAGTGVASFANPMTLSSPDTPVPTSFGPGARASIVSNLPGFVTGIKATVSIDYPYGVGNLKLLLVGPDGTTVRLVDPTGMWLSGTGYSSTTFDDAASAQVSSGMPPYTGSFAPTDPLAGLSARTAQGVFTLVAVEGAPGTPGTIRGFSLEITTAPSAPPLIEVRDGGALVGNAAPPQGGRDFGFRVTGSGAGTPSAFTISNPGGSDLGLAPPVLSGVNPGDFVLGLSGFSSRVPVGGTTSFTVSFSPRADGVRTAAVLIGHNATRTVAPFALEVAGLGTVSAPLAGTSTTPMTFSPTSTAIYSTITIPVPAGGPVVILDATVHVDVTYAPDQDLTIQLIPPHPPRIGQIVTLVPQGTGGNGANFTGTAFSDRGTTPIASGVAPFTGTFQPQTPIGALAGELADGAWTLAVVSGGTGSGTLNGWSIEIAPVAPFPTLQMNDGPKGPLVTTATSLYLGMGGLRTAQASPRTIVITNAGTAPLVVQRPALTGANAGDFAVTAPGFPATIAAGKTASFGLAISTLDMGPLAATVAIAHNATVMGLPSPFTFGVGGLGVAKVLSVSSTAVPAPVTLGSFVEVPLPVATLGRIMTATATVSITCAYASDLLVELRSPSGTAITLSDYQVGGGWSGANFTSTTFDDAAALPITSGLISAPFTGRYQPEYPLSTFGGYDPNGTWRLRVTDNYGYTTTVTAFALDIGLTPFPMIEVHEGTASGVVVAPGQGAANGRAFGDRELGGPPSVIAIAILNAGTAPLDLGAPQVAGSGEFSLDTSAYSTRVAAFGQTTLGVRFAPTQLGAASAVVSFAHDATPTASPFTFGVSGSGAQGSIEVSRNGRPMTSGSALDLGAVSVGQSSAATLVLSNTGTVGVSVGTPSLSGANAGDFSLDLRGFSSSIPPGGTASVGVSFAPTAALPQRAATLSFTHDAAGLPSPFLVALSGTGMPRPLSKSGGGGGGGCSMRPASGAADTTTPAVLLLALIVYAGSRRRRRAAAPQGR